MRLISAVSGVQLPPPLPDSFHSSPAGRAGDGHGGRRSAATKLKFSLAVVGLTLALCEIGLRIGGYQPLKPVEDGRRALIRASSDPDLRYELIPGAHGSAWGTEVQINSHGFRGPEVDQAKHGRFRVAVIGDSITFGNQVPAGGAYPDLLDRDFRASSEPIEVLNFGVAGYDVIQEVRLFEVRALAFDPDLVIVGYCLNDALDTSPNLKFIEHYEALRRNGWMRSRLVQVVAHGLEVLESSGGDDSGAFRRRWQGRIEAITESETDLLTAMAALGPNPPESWYSDRARLGRIRWGFDRLSELTRSHGIPVIVVIFPALTSANGGYPFRGLHQIVAHEAKRAGFQVLDPTDAFLSAPIESLRSRTDRGHPNQRGHRIVADLLAPLIRAHAASG